MNSGKIRLAIACGVVAAGVLSASSWASEGTTHHAHGLIKAIDTKAETVTIQHDAIPGLMMGMTMTFHVEEPEVLAGVQVGQEVNFDLREDPGRLTVTAIQPGQRSSTRDDSIIHTGSNCSCSGCMAAMM
jgi:Cu/Ag efflux protein CusF